jgi:hypothetical protein
VLVVVFVGFLGSLAPAQASHGWAYNSCSWTDCEPSSLHRHTSSGGSVEFTRLGVGRSLVRFERLGALGGSVRVNVTYDTWEDIARICQVVTFWGDGTNEYVEVACFAGWTPSDADYTVLFVDRANDWASFGEGQTAYAVADRPDLALYYPAFATQFNSAGGSVWIEREGVGVWSVHVPGLGLPATAWAQAHSETRAECVVPATWQDGSDLVIRVACADQKGPVDVMFGVGADRDAGGTDEKAASPMAFGLTFSAAKSDTGLTAFLDLERSSAAVADVISFGGEPVGVPTLPLDGVVALHHPWNTGGIFDGWAVQLPWWNGVGGDGVLFATSTEPGYTCTVQGMGLPWGDGEGVPVVCFDHQGGITLTDFTLSYFGHW